ncbi:Hypothetical protein D9617_10g074630 [Elsinoe fawcettii]|nr:Hypothetical protein D9617_10g074630 [Elsinoe fawcettii]
MHKFLTFLAFAGTSLATPLIGRQAACDQTFSSLTALSNVRNTIPAECLQTYILSILSETYTTSVRTYQQILSSTFPSIYEVYLSSLQAHVPARIAEYLSDYNATQIVCTWTSPTSEQIRVPCPTTSTVAHFNTTTWTTPNESLFLSTIYESYGIPSQWLTRSDLTFASSSPPNTPFCPPVGGDCSVTWLSYPQSSANISLPSPLPIILAALEQHKAFSSLLSSIAQQVREGTCSGSPANVSSAFALPTLMLSSAVADLERISNITSSDPNSEGAAPSFARRRTVLEGMAKAILLTVPLLSRSEAVTALTGLDSVVRMVLPLSQTWWSGWQVLGEGRGGGTQRKMALLREGNVDGAAAAVAGTEAWEARGVRSLLEVEQRGAVDLLGVFW